MENEEVNTHSVIINPANPGVQLIVSAIADIMPGVEDFEDDQMAQFLTDLIVATTVMSKEGGDMDVDSILEVMTLTYKYLDGYNGVDQ